MKKMITMILVLAVVLTALVGCGKDNSQEEAKTEAVTQGESQSASSGDSSDAADVSYSIDENSKVGVLSMLNMSEDSYSQKRKGLAVGSYYLYQQGLLKYTDENYVPEENTTLPVPEYYDSLDSMIMSLQSGDLKSIELTQSIAQYVVSRNKNLQLTYTIDVDAAEGFDSGVVERLSYGYAFLFKEDKSDLCEEFDVAIDEMEADGTLDSLKKDYINDIIDGKVPEAVDFEKTDGDTVKVAITGSLPPLDYVSPDGTPAGYNTAILAEIGKRIGKNIELVQVDSIGRATALSSGAVDVAFWTRGKASSKPGETNEEHEAFVKEQQKNQTEEQTKLMESMRGPGSYEDSNHLDMPMGTICTRPYFRDPITIVEIK